MNFFEPIEDSFVLLLRSGTYSESKLFVRNQQMFAKVGSGYARLHPSGTTSVNRLYWKEVDSRQGTHRTKGCDLVWYPNAALAAE